MSLLFISRQWYYKIVYQLAVKGFDNIMNDQRECVCFLGRHFQCYRRTFHCYISALDLPLFSYKYRASVMRLAFLSSKYRAVPAVKTSFATTELHSHALSYLAVYKFHAYISLSSLNRTCVVFRVVQNAWGREFLDRSPRAWMPPSFQQSEVRSKFTRHRQRFNSFQVPFFFPLDASGLNHILNLASVNNHWLTTQTFHAMTNFCLRRFRGRII